MRIELSSPSSNLTDSKRVYVLGDGQIRINQSNDRNAGIRIRNSHKESTGTMYAPITQLVHPVRTRQAADV